MPHADTVGETACPTSIVQVNHWTPPTAALAADTVSTVTDRPRTIVSCAVSVDGYLDDASPGRLILSGPEDLDEVDELRAAADAILVGAGTIRADNPRLLIREPRRQEARVAAGRQPHPLRVTVTATGRLDPAGRFFTGPGQPLVFVPARAAAAARAHLGDRAVVIDAGRELSLAAVLENLHEQRSVRTVLAEGGARLLRDLFAADLVDELRLAVAPFFVADERAPRFGLPAAYPHTSANPMTLRAARRLGDIVVLHYDVRG
jgi:5-amino-6-(5-phosphoribosylamino)uracil reductase